MAPFWMRLARAGNTFTASFSSDGQTWSDIGSADLGLKPDLVVGLAGCSRIKVSTTVMFDHVSVPGWHGGI
jgi:regulation of enolase protein 1 (concanavalin A-like superfamily)